MICLSDIIRCSESCGVSCVGFVTGYTFVTLLYTVDLSRYLLGYCYSVLPTRARENIHYLFDRLDIGEGAGNLLIFSLVKSLKSTSSVC